MIVTVEPDSVAEQAGLRPGDRLLAINDQPLRDVIDVQIYAAESELTFLVARDQRRMALHAQRRYGQPLGLEFDAVLFDGPLRLCRNNCEFCFVSQMPPGMRPTLYVKDDDYRYSFLNGTYITLTNLSEADWERIEEQFLSPLYVSVHATEPELRVQLMRNPRAGAIRAQLARLVEMGIEVHTQVVLVPGRNDGDHLDRTIADLAALYPGVMTLSIVPVGLTRQHNPALRPYTDQEAAVILAQVLAWHTRLRDDLGVGFVYPSDEWYLRAGKAVPPLEIYDGMLPAMIETGVGMVRLFLESWQSLQAELANLGGPRQTWVTGLLFAPVLREQAQRFTQQTGIAVDVVAVRNRMFGETVTVAGLLTVEDILHVLEDAGLGDVIVLPEEIFRGPEGQALDDQPAHVIHLATGKRVHVAGQPHPPD